MNINDNSLKNRFTAILLAKKLDDLDALYEELCLNIDRLYDNKHAQIVIEPDGSTVIVQEHDKERKNCIPVLSYDELSFKDDICYDIATALANLENP